MTRIFSNDEPIGRTYEDEYLGLTQRATLPGSTFSGVASDDVMLGDERYFAEERADRLRAAADDNEGVVTKYGGEEGSKIERFMRAWRDAPPEEWTEDARALRGEYLDAQQRAESAPWYSDAWADVKLNPEVYAIDAGLLALGLVAAPFTGGISAAAAAGRAGITWAGRTATRRLAMRGAKRFGLGLRGARNLRRGIRFFPKVVAGGRSRGLWTIPAVGSRGAIEAMLAEGAGFQLNRDQADQSEDLLAGIGVYYNAQDELTSRLTVAGIAGGAIGGALGGVSQIPRLWRTAGKFFEDRVASKRARLVLDTEVEGVKPDAVRKGKFIYDLRGRSDEEVIAVQQSIAKQEMKQMGAEKRVGEDGKEFIAQSATRAKELLGEGFEKRLLGQGFRRVGDEFHGAEVSPDIVARKVNPKAELGKTPEETVAKVLGTEEKPKPKPKKVEGATTFFQGTKAFLLKPRGGDAAKKMSDEDFQEGVKQDLYTGGVIPDADGIIRPNAQRGLEQQKKKGEIKTGGFEEFAQSRKEKQEQEAAKPKPAEGKDDKAKKAQEEQAKVDKITEKAFPLIPPVRITGVTDNVTGKSYEKQSVISFEHDPSLHIVKEGDEWVTVHNLPEGEEGAIGRVSFSSKEEAISSVREWEAQKFEKFGKLIRRIDQMEEASKLLRACIARS